MSIASEITRISENIADSYTAVSSKGGTLPVSQNSDNLPTAIASIPSGSGPDAYIPRSLTTSGTDVIFGTQDMTETSFSTGTATIVDKSSLRYAFYNSNTIPNISLPNVVEARVYAFNYAFAYESGSTGSTYTFSAPVLEEMENNCFDHAFYYDSPCESFSLPAVTQVHAMNVFSNAFEYNTKIETFSMPELTTMSYGSSAFSSCCKNATGVTTFNFPKLKTITDSSSAFSGALQWNTSKSKTGDLEVEFPALETITNSSSAFSNFCQHNKNAKFLSFPELKIITNSANCFQNAYVCEGGNTTQRKVYFNKLRTISGSNNAFSNFMKYNTATYLADFDFGSLDEIVNSSGCFSYAFGYNLGTKCAGRVNLFPKLRRISNVNNYAGAEFSSAFDQCSQMTSCVFPELEYIYHTTKQDSYSVFYNAFMNCSNCTKLEFPKIADASGGFLCKLYANGLTEIVFGMDIGYLGPYSFSEVFTSKSNLDFIIPACTIGGDNAIRQLGLSSSVIRFPVLTRIQNNNQYTMNYMLSGGSNNTVHFPINMKTNIETIFGQNPTFGGTNTTVLYDLVYSVSDGTITYTRYHNGYNTTSYGYHHDYFDGANGVRYYKIPVDTSSGTLVFPDGTKYDNKRWYSWEDTNGNKVITFDREPSVGDNVWSQSGQHPILTTIASITFDRVFVPNTAEPQVGDTLYSDEECTQEFGTVSTIA